MHINLLIFLALACTTAAAAADDGDPYYSRYHRDDNNNVKADAQVEDEQVSQYCDLNERCPRPRDYEATVEHTMCTFVDDQPGNACHNTLEESRFLTSTEKEDILRMHNQVRQMAMKGKVPGQPAARDLEPLVWDAELELFARRWAVQCIYANDACRISKEGDYGRNGTGLVGQNLALLSNSADYVSRFPEMIQRWFEEYKKVTTPDIDRMSDKLHTGTAYTQMVWASTKRLGCERVFFNRTAEDVAAAAANVTTEDVAADVMTEEDAAAPADDVTTEEDAVVAAAVNATTEGVVAGGVGTGITEYLVCNYGPAGNWVGDEVYKKEVKSKPRKIYPFMQPPSQRAEDAGGQVAHLCHLTAGLVLCLHVLYHVVGHGGTLYWLGND